MATQRDLPPPYAHNTIKEKGDAPYATESFQGWNNIEQQKISLSAGDNGYMPLRNSRPGQSENPYESTVTSPPVAGVSPTVIFGPQATSSIPAPAPTIMTINSQAIPGSCPVCHSVGGFSTGFTCCGYVWCICCFPCGIICCLMCNRKKSCRHCNFSTT